MEKCLKLVKGILKVMTPFIVAKINVLFYSLGIPINKYAQKRIVL